MFDVGFPELVLVSIVALVVIGPERLPETVRTIMLWLGRIRQTFTNIKTELEQEIGADEIRRQLHNETVLKDLRDSKETITNTISGTLKDIDQSVKEIDESVKGIESPAEVNKPDAVSEEASPDSNPPKTATDKHKDSDESERRTN